jgi:hypothetical protein
MIPKKLLDILVTPFWQQGTEVVYYAQCCGRFYVGKTPPVKCSTCELIPKVEHLDKPQSLC